MAITLYTIEAIIKDIQIKNELIDSEKMKIASVISASVAHEIRNPLTSVRGFIQLLSTAPDLSAEKRRYYGQICIDELDRAEQIISDYLSLARPYPDIYEKLIIGEEINYISTVLSSYANLKGVEITVENDEIDLLILGDRQKFRQSIINIVKNGIEAMEQGGILTLNVYKQDNRVHVMINDKGIGMTKEQINRLGTPYFSSKEKGTGLGTMVSFSIIKGMNGIISVMSEVGKGTQYNVSFPLS